MEGEIEEGIEEGREGGRDNERDKGEGEREGGNEGRQSQSGNGIRSYDGTYEIGSLIMTRPE